MVLLRKKASLAACLLVWVPAVLTTPGAAGAAPAALSGVNDPLAPLQWHLRRDGLPAAWPQSRGGDVVVAVVDSGVDLRHRDLRQNLWTNPGEVAGNGLDDDRNGFVDDVHGFDFVAGDSDPADEDGHGTHVAGVLGARGGNGLGVTGVAQRVRIMAVRALDAHHRGNTDWLVSALDYAIANGARIVNVSINTPVAVPAVDAAIRRARAAGVLLVVSAGNDGRNLDRTPSYPACSTSPNVITVGSVGRRGARSSFSNFGSCVDLAAPGEDIASTRNGGGYELRSGTSMAAPQVAGAAVLALALHPRIALDRLVGALVAPVRPARAALAWQGMTTPALSAAEVLRRLGDAR